MNASVAAAAWPVERVGEALHAVARAAGLSQSDASLPARPPEGAELTPWLEVAGRRLGLAVEEIEARHFELDSLVRGGGPAILSLSSGEGDRLLLLLAGKGRVVKVVCPDLQIRRLGVDDVRAALAEPIEDRFGPQVDEILDGAGIPPRRRNRARRALLDEQLGAAFVGRCWMLRQPVGSSFFGQLKKARLLTKIALLTSCHIVQYMLFLCSWWLIGRGALTGQMDSVWLLGWALLLLTLVPLRMLTTYLQGRVVIGAGCLMKRRLLAGVMRLDIETIKHEGAGMLLGRVIEANALEALVLGGGHLALLASIEVVFTIWVLCQGAGGIWHGLLFACWIVFTLGLVWRYFKAVDSWTGIRLDLTNDLTERMVGHRTRLAQRPPEEWHEGEDEMLDSYLSASYQMDRMSPYVAQAQFVWRLVGLLGLTIPFVSGQFSVGAMAVGLGGVLLGSRALARFTSGYISIAIASIAWRRVAPVFHAAAVEQAPGSLPASGGAGDDDSSAVVTAHDLSFVYSGRAQPAVNGASLTIRTGDRLLLVGPSGGGKSTLVSLLSGLRSADSGLVLCHGLDMKTLGAAGWRSHIAAAPQFHDNHVFAETFAFNLLMGRSWPPTVDELDKAESLCRELGLGELLDRMPAGIMQMVGDTGWQLSHGEQSRLFVARALLQDAGLVILDESFGALDPTNLRRAVDCARRHAKTLLVVAHP